MHPELKEAIAKIMRAAKENKKSTGIYATSGEQARSFADQGFNMVWCRLRPRSRFAKLIMPIGIRCCRHGRFTHLSDLRTNGRKGIICPLGVECGQGCSVRSSEDDPAIMSLCFSNPPINLYIDLMTLAQLCFQACPSASSMSASTCASLNRCISFRASVAMSGFE